MRNFKNLHFLLLAGLVGCAGVSKKPVHHHTSRSLASMNETLNDSEKLQSRVDKLMSGVFHGYMMGQVHLQEFDKLLDKDPQAAMKSDAYSSLLSIRTFVDQFEHEINDLYVELVMVTSLPQFNDHQKKNAQVALDSIGKFLEGVKTDNKELPENLKPLILSNLREKQMLLFEELKSLHDDSAFTNNDPEVKKVLHKNQVLLRATKRSYFKELQNYKVDSKVLTETIKAERNKKNYKDLEKEIKALSKEMKVFISEFGRGTSSDVIFPSAGPNGNITGRNFPQNTWSLTYDDGPAKTTDQVINNLLERKIPATFFMLAKQAEAYPNTVKKIVDNNFDVASHSYTHAQLTKVGPVQLEKEIGTSKKVIEAKTGKTIKLFRLPYGAGVSVSKVRAKIAEHKMVHVFWTVDTLDWQDKNPQSILARTLKQMNAQAKNSGVILFHDIHSQSVTASTLLMDHFNKNKLIVCTVQGVVNQLNDNLDTCK